MTIHEKINRAIVDHYGLTGWSEATTEAIRRDAGEEGLALIREISSLANQPEQWIHAASHMGAYEEVQRLLREKYPFLWSDAVVRVATAAAYGWK
jgi:hypothetical protein